MEAGDGGIGGLTTFLLILLAVNTTALVVVTILYRKAKKASKTRRVEAPNSQYKSEYVRDLEAKDRWERIDLDALHEVNREEFEKILAKVRATSVRALTTRERDFLDRMADAHDRVVRQKKGPVSGPRRLPGTSS
ncbi:MAG: hypothetical protein PVI57_08485 [Gemmatimonadota bacterium]|jgi:hypothetical protein